MLYLIGVLIMVFGIAVSIALHEIGHLLPAKAFRVRCTQYMVGFGSTLWSTRRGETEYGIKAVPLGGYVRMIGMFPPGKDGRVRASSSNPFHQMVEQARTDSLEEVGPDDDDRVFYRLPVWKRLIIMAGGPLMNLALAAGLMGLVITAHGVPSDLTPTLSNVQACVNDDITDVTCEGQPPSPALAAGLQVGDRILSVNGEEVTTWSQASYAIQNAGAQATFVVDRDGQQETLTADLVVRERPVIGTDGRVQLDEKEEPVMREVSFLGASGSVLYERQPISEVPGVVNEMFKGTAGIVLTLPAHLVNVANAAFGPDERDIEGPMSVVGAGRVAGDVSQSGLMPGDTTTDKLWWLVSIIASLNMALFVFNLIPLLPLDGGHIAGALWEGLKRTVARVFGRPDPGPVDTAKALPVAYAVAIGLLAMSALLIYADIVKPIRLT
ncbi:M50 family metallopeptidase [Ornithinimicrobium pratense]|uniref:Site-2 protease family protein n=1 Tax=Ornithinimicrobium pratense TaxID=2593973 RepID=A0A5J6V7A5_9MICO|nr:site-2 protease family protein [Ornithinimicrobium pratense]QFG68942.1 site-2 protease family protein [Ornithinimicrobium pratense]